MFTSNGTKRRRFISFVNRNLERVLAINTPTEGRIDSETFYFNTVETTSEEDLQAISAEQQEHQLRKRDKVLAIIATIPRGIARRLIPRDTLNNLREALQGLRLDQLPAAILEQINEIL